MFQHLLREEAIALQFDAPNREAALAGLIALLPSRELGPKQKAKLLEILLQREDLGTTAMGDGVALPHGVLPDLSEPLASLAVSRKGIAYPSLDGAPVHLMLLTVFPEGADFLAKRYLLLHESENVLRDPFIRQQLMGFETASEVHELLLRETASVRQPLRAAAIA